MFVIMVDLPVPRYALNSLNWQKKAQSPTGTKNISQVGAPGPATLWQLPFLQLAPGLTSGY